MKTNEQHLRALIARGEGMDCEFKASRRQLPYLSIDTAELDGKTLLHIYVPESSQVHRCNARIYDRNEDADLDITDLTVEVARLYQRKQATYSENRIYPFIRPDSLRADLIDQCRRYIRLNRKNHPWTIPACCRAPQSARSHLPGSGLQYADSP